MTKQRGRFKCKTLVCLFMLIFAQVTASSCTLGLKEKILGKVTTPGLGAARLGPAWTDQSLVACSLNCWTRYPHSLQTIMYNAATKLCTPGSRLVTSSALAPSSAEGDLYAPIVCDTNGGFQFVSSGSVSSCLLISPQTMSYFEAKQFCQGFGAYLFSAKNLEKFKLLPDETFLIGMTDIANEGTFVWDEDNSVIPHDQARKIFRPEEPYPADVAGSDCVSVRGGNNYLRTGNDFSCNSGGFRVPCERRFKI